MYEYIFYTYIGVLVVFIFKGYQYIYKIDTTENNNNEFKYSLFNNDETNDLNKLLLNETRIPYEINNNQTLIRLKIHNFKEHMNDGLDRMVSSIKNIYKNNIETKYSKINNNQEPDNIELTSHDINMQTQNNSYNNYTNPNSYNNYSAEYNNSNITYIEDDLNSTINTIDLNSTINTIDLNSINTTDLNISINDNTDNTMFHSAMSR